MNRYKQIAGVLAVSYCIGAVALAQEVGTNREADHQALRALRAKVTTAVNNQDIKTLLTFFAKDFVITTADQTVITNKAAFEAYYAHMFTDAKGPLAKMQTVVDADILTRFTDPNTGYCYGSSLATYNLKDGRVIKIKERWTAVVVKEAGDWKLGAAQVGVNFLDNPVLTARSMSSWKKLCIWLHMSKPPTD